MQGLVEQGMAGPHHDLGKRSPHQAEHRNAGGAEEKSAPDPKRRAGPLVGRDHQPQEQQRRGDSRGADDGGEGFEKQEHQATRRFGSQLRRV